ncbi:MAG TPA: mevalonate kinase, partial [Methanocella sp.]|nr:mevalonate kinase [Methanocella sp.]
MVKYSAPGKIFLFGEHAVVYEKRAIACAIDLRTTVEITSAKSGGMHIQSSAFRDEPDKNEYIKTAINKFGRLANIDGINVRVYSDIPVASGLGSSAAVSIATIAALNDEYGTKMSLDEIAFMGYQTELEVQG